jgi:hypothetical protein
VPKVERKRAVFHGHLAPTNGIQSAIAFLKKFQERTSGLV